MFALAHDFSGQCIHLPDPVNLITEEFDPHAMLIP
ncbi:Uncharacterised protein [Mycobacteroides abscessus subsp. abscessus]|nr:Uncharacterised protein [Mycobacteroides abscessus subsp. abscessus]